MGYAMLEGWLSVKEELEIWVVERAETLRERASGAEAIAYTNVSDLPESFSPDLIFLAVKPQVMSKVLLDYKRWSGGRTTFISVAAGLTVDFFENALPGATPVIRCMPNTPASIGAGAIVCYANSHVSQSTKVLTERLLSCSGSVSYVEDENLMDAVTAISGSGPAYVFYFIEALKQAGEATGLPPQLALKLATQTVYGAASLAKQSEEAPDKLRERVTSPAGTTAAALDIFMTENRLMNLVSEAVKAAAKRSVELSNI